MVLAEQSILHHGVNVDNAVAEVIAKMSNKSYKTPVNSDLLMETLKPPQLLLFKWQQIKSGKNFVASIIDAVSYFNR